MICPNCGCFFCPEYYSELDKNSQIFCSRKCKRRNSRKINRRHQQGKIHYKTEKEANQALFRLRRDRPNMPDPGVYYCCTRGWNVTSDLGEEIDKTKYQPKNPHLSQNIILPRGWTRKLGITEASVRDSAGTDTPTHTEPSPNG